MTNVNMFQLSKINDNVCVCVFMIDGWFHGSVNCDINVTE